jgi:Ni/Co efflux regulator RcnB
VERGNGQGGQQWQGQAGGQQVERFNGGQHFQGRGGFGFENHALRGRDQGRSWFNGNEFAHQYRAERRFHFGGYGAYPRGWFARTWYFGDFLPGGWYGSDYYLDWAEYGLPPPPIGCEWIAEGPDAVLVDVWTGEVLSVYRGVFW